jgi:hypothetical protein
MSGAQGTTAADCGEAFYSAAPAPVHSGEWTAPEDGEECVTISVAQAAMMTDYYHTNTVREACCL